jgi:hypothetical protein
MMEERDYQKHAIESRTRHLNGRTALSSWPRNAERLMEHLVLARSSTGTVFVRVNGRPSTADQVVRCLTSSTAAELHPTQRRKRSGAYSTRAQKFSLHVTVVILLISYIPQWRILLYEAYVRIRMTYPIWMGCVCHSAVFGRIRPSTSCAVDA